MLLNFLQSVAVICQLTLIGFHRYYLKTNGVPETLVTDEIAADMLKESTVIFLQLNAAEIALQLTMQDYNVFRQIEATEYIDELFELKSNYGTPALSQFSQVYFLLLTSFT